MSDLTRRDVLRLQAESLLSEVTLRRRLVHQRPLQPSCELRLQEAARRLGIEIPELPSPEVAKTG